MALAGTPGVKMVRTHRMSKSRPLCQTYEIAQFGRPKLFVGRVVSNFHKVGALLIARGGAALTNDVSRGSAQAPGSARPRPNALPCHAGPALTLDGPRPATGTSTSASR